MLLMLVLCACCRSGKPVYRPNVMMAIGTDVAVVCADSVADEKERRHLLVRGGTCAPAAVTHLLSCVNPHHLLRLLPHPLLSPPPLSSFRLIPAFPQTIHTHPLPSHARPAKKNPYTPPTHTKPAKAPPH